MMDTDSWLILSYITQISFPKLQNAAPIRTPQFATLMMALA